MSESRLQREQPSLQQPLNKGGVSLPLSTKPTNCPPIDKELIEHLRRIFEVQVHRQYDIRDYDRMVGQQEVIGYLFTNYMKQQEN